jgi:acyl-coenzyme A thioesterase PaaI-like protein
MDPAERVRASFARQPYMTLLGARIVHAAPGEVDIELPFGEPLTQQHGVQIARGRVDKVGRTLTFTTGEAVAGDTRVATFSATIMAVRGRAGLTD